MTETEIVNIALVVRVLLVGGFLLLLPRITRRGLLFGVYVGEARVEEEEVRGLLRRWHVGCLVLIVVSWLVGTGISLAGSPMTGNLTGTAVLLLGALGLYLRSYYRARELAPPSAALQAAQSTAPLAASEAKGLDLAKLVLGICVLASLATFAYALVLYEGPWSGNPFVAVMLVPSANLLISPIVALFAVLTATAKRSLRGGSGGRSVEAQDAFRTTMTRFLSWTALLTCSSMTLLSVQISHVRLSEMDSAWTGIGWSVVVLGFILVSLVRIVRRYGQGGALLEAGSVDAPLTDGLADNTHWVWGLFYVDRDDPSIMVEKRFGLGYTLNYGNRTAVLIVAGFLVMLLGLTALLFGATMAGG